MNRSIMCSYNRTMHREKIDRYTISYGRDRNYRVVKWARPYNSAKIISIDTHLRGRFRYSPKFKQCIAETNVVLTGKRNKDYLIAEAQSGSTHIPGITVWHHVWEENNGKYLMQLVDIFEHKKTCPHAGGCKLWSIKNNMKYRNNVSYNTKHGSIGIHRVENYNDIVGFYRIDSNKRQMIQNAYVSKKSISIARRRGIYLTGIDMYGDLLYTDGINYFFWNHEIDKYSRIIHTDISGIYIGEALL